MGSRASTIARPYRAPVFVEPVSSWQSAAKSLTLVLFSTSDWPQDRCSTDLTIISGPPFSGLRTSFSSARSIT